MWVMLYSAFGQILKFKNVDEKKDNVLFLFDDNGHVKKGYLVCILKYAPVYLRTDIALQRLRDITSA